MFLVFVADHPQKRAGNEGEKQQTIIHVFSFGFEVWFKQDETK